MRRPSWALTSCMSTYTVTNHIEAERLVDEVVVFVSLKVLSTVACAKSLDLHDSLPKLYHTTFGTMPATTAPLVTKNRLAVKTQAMAV